MRAKTFGLILTITGVLAAQAALSPAQASPAPARSPARSQRAVVPLSADLTIIRVTGDAAGLHDQLETQRFYRDSRGRTRTESGTVVTISDPATGTITLDTKAGTFTEQARQPQAAGPRTAQPKQSGTADRRLSSPPRKLGEAVVEGVPTQGSAYTLTIPPAATGRRSAKRSRSGIRCSCNCR
ncbi:hypothetical protein Rhe02_02320 [Rhizocola hellebori]|uniref:Uncharacterized protein n=1 Tax=Rhizocola hellebori TaxID=1392758 RepID=A0A8J3Q2J4_9ACTN|nr:hypothetical protein [Rhizocola hellebori]GIH02165.1 hypothetical protein Rhe02_02320 [Rhizocola hellebori]